jgi:hypothetical protein
VPPISSASRVNPDARNPTATITLIFIRSRNYSCGVMSCNHLFRRKVLGLSVYWPRNAEWLGTAPLML